MIVLGLVPFTFWGKKVQLLPYRVNSSTFCYETKPLCNCAIMLLWQHRLGVFAETCHFISSSNFKERRENTSLKTKVFVYKTQKKSFKIIGKLTPLSLEQLFGQLLTEVVTSSMLVHFRSRQSWENGEGKIDKSNSLFNVSAFFFLPFLFSSLIGSKSFSTFSVHDKKQKPNFESVRSGCLKHVLLAIHVRLRPSPV